MVLLKMAARPQGALAAVLLVLADLWFLAAARSHFWGFGKVPWYSDMATVLLMGVLSGIFFILGRKYLTLWQGTGQWIWFSKVVEFILLPLIVLSWFVKYHWWLLFGDIVVGISAVAVVLLMLWLRGPLGHFVDHEVKIRDFEYILGTQPVKHRGDMLLADIAFWATCLIPLIFFWHQGGFFVWVPK
jgi:hypothetical protein